MEDVPSFQIGQRCEGKDIRDDWHLTTLTSKNTDGTFQARVHDGFNTLWKNVHPANLRQLRLPPKPIDASGDINRGRHFLRNLSTSPPPQARLDSPSPYFGYSGTDVKASGSTSTQTTERPKKPKGSLQPLYYWTDGKVMSQLPHPLYYFARAVDDPAKRSAEKEEDEEKAKIPFAPTAILRRPSAEERAEAEARREEAAASRRVEGEKSPGQASLRAEECFTPTAILRRPSEYTMESDASRNMPEETFRQDEGLVVVPSDSSKRARERSTRETHKNRWKKVWRPVGEEHKAPIRKISNVYTHPLMQSYQEDPRNVILTWQKLPAKERKRSLEDLIERALLLDDGDEGDAVLVVFIAILRHGVKKQWLKQLNRIMHNASIERKGLWIRLHRTLGEFWSEANVLNTEQETGV